MDADEWEVLELAGAYFFALSLVPTAWYESQPKPVKLTRDQNQNVVETWWEHHEPAISTVDYFDEQLIRVDSSPYEHELKDTVWTDEHHHQVELWEYEADGVAHLDIFNLARFSRYVRKVLEPDAHAQHCETLYRSSRAKNFLHFHPFGR